MIALVLTIVLHGAAPATACSRQVAGRTAAVITHGATVNGRRLWDGPVVGRHEWWVGDGTQVELSELVRRGPVCVTAQSWLRRARVRVRLTIAG